jgi:large subunit ribosomal protein L9
MEVILLEDVESLGHEGDIVRVADGHARNFLIPKSLAVPATRAAKGELERRRGAIERREAQKAEAARKVADGLHSQPLTVPAKAGEGGKLHGTVTAQQIAEALAAQTGVTLDRRRISLVEPIREVGDYLVAAEVYKGVNAQLKIRVVPHDRPAGEADEAEGPDADEAEEPEADEAEAGEAAEDE